LNKKNIRHIKYDSTIFFVDKLAQGLQSVSTPYSVICAEDDFIVPTGIKECMDFLENNQDYFSAHGRYINHQLINDQKGRLKIRWGILYEKAISISDANATERFNHFLPDNYSGYPMYAVYRTKTLQTIWQETSKYVSDWGLAELFPSCLSLILGKMKILTVFYASREANTERCDEVAHLETMYSEEKCQKAIEGLSMYLCNMDGLGRQEALETVKGKLNIVLTRVSAKMKSWERSSKVCKNETLISKVIQQGISFPNRILIKLDRIMLWRVNPWHFYYEFFKIKQSIKSASVSDEVLNRTRREYHRQPEK